MSTTTPSVSPLGEEGPFHPSDEIKTTPARSHTTITRHRRILFVDQSGELGGGELSLLDLVAPWKRNSEVVLFADGPFRHRLEERGVRVSVEPISPRIRNLTRNDGLLASLGSVRSVYRLAWRIARRARRYDLLYANSQKALVVAALAGRLANRPVVWHLRDVLSAEHLSTAHRRTAIILANLFVQRVLCNSQATYDAFVKCGGRSDRAIIVYNGIDPVPFSRTNAVSAVRTDFKIPVNAPLVGVFSRLATWKGQDVLIRALGSLPDTHALVVGKALFVSDAAYETTLRRLAIENDVSDRVHFLGFRNDVPDLMRAVDVVCHTSTAAEPFGRVIVEGMLASRPVVATAAGGALEIVDDGVTGRLVPPGDVDALVANLIDLFEAPETARIMGMNGRAKALRHFSLEAVIRAVDAVFTRLLPPFPNE